MKPFKDEKDKRKINSSNQQINNQYNSNSNNNHNQNQNQQGNQILFLFLYKIKTKIIIQKSQTILQINIKVLQIQKILMIIGSVKIVHL